MTEFFVFLAVVVVLGSAFLFLLPYLKKDEIIIEKKSSEVETKKKLEMIERVRALKDAHNLSPIEFENLVMLLFKRFGYEVNKTSYTGDGGVDLRLTKGARKEIVQCKRYRGNVSVQQVREFFGVMVSENIQKGYIVTTGHFTFSAVQFAQGKGIHLIDGPELAEMLSNNNAHL